MRRPHVFWAGQWAGAVPTPAHMRALDQYSSELVNGDDGGTWEPSQPISLGSTASPGISLTTAGSLLSGDIETRPGNERGGELDTPGIVLQGGAIPTFGTPRTRNVTVGFGAFLEFDYGQLTTWDTDLTPFFELDPLTLGAKCTRYVFSSRGVVLTVPLPLRAQHRGATIDRVDFRVIVGGQHAALPTQMMRFRVIRVWSDTLGALHTASSGGYDADGWLVDPAATVADLTNNGAMRTISYVPNVSNIDIDPSDKFFAVQAQMHSSPAGMALLSPEDRPVSTFVSATVALSNITDLRQE